MTRKITVRRNRVTANGRVIEQKTTKTKAGLHGGTLRLRGRNAVGLAVAEAEEAEAAQEAWQTEGHIITMRDRRPLDPAYITRLFQKLRKGHGEELPQLTFHGLDTATHHCRSLRVLTSR